MNSPTESVKNQHTLKNVKILYLCFRYIYYKHVFVYVIKLLDFI